MTRRMADSITPADLPDGFDLYGGYDDGRYNDIAAIKARFPGKTVIAFTVFAHDNYGDCLDIEKGDATVEQAPAWTTRRRLAGHGGPLNYCAWSTLPALKAQYAAQKVTEPGYIVAGYPAPDGDAIPPGCVGHQWIDHGHYDESIIVNYLPGIDPNPHPTIVPEDLFSMLASDPAFAVRFLYLTFFLREPDAQGFATDVAYLNNGGTLNQLLTNLADSPEGQAVTAAKRKALGLSVA